MMYGVVDHSLTVWLVRYSTRFCTSCSSPTLTLFIAFSCTIMYVIWLMVYYCGIFSSRRRRGLPRLLFFSSSRSTRCSHPAPIQSTGNSTVLYSNILYSMLTGSEGFVGGGSRGDVEEDTSGEPEEEGIYRQRDKMDGCEILG